MLKIIPKICICVACVKVADYSIRVSRSTSVHHFYSVILFQLVIHSALALHWKQTYNFVSIILRII